jgi:hypothetical protein
MKVHDSLKKKWEKFTGIYAYYPKHRTERLLKHITLTIAVIDGKTRVLLTKLTGKQREVLSLLELKENVFCTLPGIFMIWKYYYRIESNYRHA